MVQPDVDEALRLMRMSKMSLYEDKASNAAQDPITAIYTAIRDNAVLTGKRTFLWSELTAQLGRTYTVRSSLSSGSRTSLQYTEIFELAAWVRLCRGSMIWLQRLACFDNEVKKRTILYAELQLSSQTIHCAE